jgi:nitrous oxide reductase accessory protein NosL
MRTAAILAVVLLMCACGSLSPVPVRAGDICDSCGKVITDVKIAGEAISPRGSVMKFRTAECLAKYTREHPENVAAKFVTDYKSGRFIRPESATYVHAVVDENTREMAYVAFSAVNDAVEFGKQQMSPPVDWLMIQRMSAEKKSN